MKIIFIRHGRTRGNLEKRYIGAVDEGLCPEGAEELLKNKGKYPAADILFLSPMKRCLQTAEILYGDSAVPVSVIEEFREIDFGDFEGKNHRELERDPDYIKWIESGGSMRFPNGEDRGDFIRRCSEGFLRAVSLCSELPAKNGEVTAVFIVHGGTVMSILQSFAGGDYYDYLCENGHGFLCRITDGTDRGQKDNRKIQILKRF